LSTSRILAEDDNTLYFHTLFKTSGKEGKEKAHKSLPPLELINRDPFRCR